MGDWEQGIMFGLIVGIVAFTAIIFAFIWAGISENQAQTRVDNFCIENGYEEDGWYDGNRVCIRKEGNIKYVSRIKVNTDGIFFVKYNGEEANAVAEETHTKEVTLYE